MPERVADQRLAVTECDSIVSSEGMQLFVERTGQTEIIVIEEGDEFARAFSYANVACIRETAICLQSDVSNAFNSGAPLARFVGRTVVDDDHFEIGTCILRALDCARQKPGTVISRNDHAYFRHDVCEDVY